MAKKAYVKNKDFMVEMIQSKKDNVLTPTAVKMILKIATHVSATKYYYVFEDDRYTCMSQGVEDCLRYWRNFNPEKYDNPFAYFTMIILNGMKRQFNQLYPIPASKKISLNTASNIYNI